MWAESDSGNAQSGLDAAGGGGRGGIASPVATIRGPFGAGDHVRSTVARWINLQGRCTKGLARRHAPRTCF